MRNSLTKLCLALMLAAPVAGCLERGGSTMVAADNDDDDAFCRANNVKAGSPEYVACRKDRDVQRGNASSRLDRAHRDLGEYMLNHPN